MFAKDNCPYDQDCEYDFECECYHHYLRCRRAGFFNNGRCIEVDEGVRDRSYYK